MPREKSSPNAAFFGGEQSVGHTKMAKPETFYGLFNDAPGIRKQSTWLIPQVDFLPTAQFCVRAEPREVCHEFIRVSFFNPILFVS
jgi:hypothetical protein